MRNLPVGEAQPCSVCAVAPRGFLNVWLPGPVIADADELQHIEHVSRLMNHSHSIVTTGCSFSDHA